jgi:pSer/pThr/pTyr-binding forkhead associated (FHA) protein
MDKLCQLRGLSGPVSNQIIKLGERDISLGRDLANDIVIVDSEVSRNHAHLSWQNGGHVVRDLKSTNGTWINGRAASTGSTLALGDTLTLGKVSVFVYELVPEAELDTSREGDPGDIIESTMAMPAVPAAVAEARLLARPQAPKPATLPEQRVPVQAAAAAQAPVVLDTELSPGRSFCQQYLAHLQAGDLDGLLSLYHADASLLSIDRGVSGTHGIRQFFQQYFGGVGRLQTKSTGNYVEGRDSIMCETRLDTPVATARVQDVFVLRDGKATHHFTCTVEVTPKPT